MKHMSSSVVPKNQLKLKYKKNQKKLSKLKCRHKLLTQVARIKYKSKVRNLKERKKTTKNTNTKKQRTIHLYHTQIKHEDGYKTEKMDKKLYRNTMLLS